MDLLEEFQATERANVMFRIGAIAQLEIQDWSALEVKKIGNVYQGKSNALRFYFGISGRDLIICHVCRKRSQKANRQDLARAEANFADYLENNT